jgi:hypothetical protein
MERVSYLNDGDPTLEKRVGTDDRPNNFSASVLYQLPLGRGKRFLGNAHPLVNAVLGDWEVSMLYTFHSGAPLSWSSSNVIYYGGQLNYDPRRVNNSFDTTRFNTVSSQQLSQNYRYFGSQFNNMRVDGTNNWNVSVMKDFSIWERLKVQFRSDSFNLTNHALFGGANVTATNAAFSKVTSQTNTPRVIQFSLRVMF